MRDKVTGDWCGWEELCGRCTIELVRGFRQLEQEVLTMFSEHCRLGVHVEVGGCGGCGCIGGRRQSLQDQDTIVAGIRAATSEEVVQSWCSALFNRVVIMIWHQHMHVGRHPNQSSTM